MKANNIVIVVIKTRTYRIILALGGVKGNFILKIVVKNIYTISYIPLSVKVSMMPMTI